MGWESPQTCPVQVFQNHSNLDIKLVEKLSSLAMTWKLLTQSLAKTMKFTALVLMIESLCQFKQRGKYSFLTKVAVPFSKVIKTGTLSKQCLTMMLTNSITNSRKTVKWLKIRSLQLPCKTHSELQSHQRMTSSSLTPSDGDSTLRSQNASLEIPWKLASQNVISIAILLNASLRQVNKEVVVFKLTFLLLSQPRSWAPSKSMFHQDSLMFTLRTTIKSP